MVNFMEETMESLAKLKSGRGGHLGGVRVNRGEGVVNDGARAPLTLGGNAEGGDAEVGEVLD
jgi:hypothetical protein